MSQDDIDKLVTGFFNMKPIHLSLLHNLLEVTAEGMMMASLNRFTTVSSLVQFTNINLLHAGKQTYRAMINKCDIRHMQWIRHRFTRQIQYDGEFHIAVT